jgi:hypothetical protein
MHVYESRALRKVLVDKPYCKLENIIGMERGCEIMDCIPLDFQPIRAYFSRASEAIPHYLIRSLSRNTRRVILFVIS